MKEILLLMSDTGGGHRASAEALAAGFAAHESGGFRTQIVDLWSDYTPWPINQLPRTYSPIVNYAPWIWKAMWKLSEIKWLMHPLLQVVARLSQKRMSNLFNGKSYDLIISVHPLMQEIPIWLLKQCGLQTIPYVTVVTDLATANPTWFHRDVDLCFVASGEAKQRAIRAGIPSAKIRLSGLPIRPEFAIPNSSKGELRSKLGLDQERQTVLLMGGGEGMAILGKIGHEASQRLASASCFAQLVIICGRNKRLRDRLISAEWLVPTRIEGFVQNMHEWMAASDCIVTKAGPGTIAEALALGLPVVIYGHIPGQEDGNISFVVDNGAGVYQTDPSKIANTIAQLFSTDRESLTRYSNQARDLGRPEATEEIVGQLVALLESGK